MKLVQLFEKPVHRHIEGVIKADDDAGLRQEVEEYVLTDEVSRELRGFLEAYHMGTGGTGAWVSGFFGCGKSHLLKMLALLLENRPIDGIPVMDIFLPRCRADQQLRDTLKKAAAIPSRSILFNIDQKAAIITKSQKDALLTVFVKVFDEACGYYGNLGYIAQFERHLDKKELYQKFKQAYRDIAGQEWESGREEAVLESGNVDKAYAAVCDDSNVKNILGDYRKDYNMSIQDFADNVNEYINQQEQPGFRLNFFVDEVGQYIAGNVKLMTNLQTIAESLAVRCDGRAWLVVTAQEDMESVIGGVPSRDFSKISDRFRHKLKLTSKNVAEVIQKRLLLKNREGAEQLKSIFKEQQNNFRTLFDFTDGSATYRNFRDQDHFIHAYPFIPYQFDLFQESIRSLSDHNAFEGRHRSVGERSMLAVFQEVVKQLAEKTTGQLAPFDMMYEGLRGTLKSQARQSINKAENHLENPLALRVLKALFLVKYIKSFKASARNICILLQDAFTRDPAVLRNDVIEALVLLEKQSYIHREGEFYQFLTNEEQDVEQEIKNTEIENTEIIDELADIIFKQELKLNKIRGDSGRDFQFARKVDDRLVGHEQELTIHVISPFYTHHEKEDSIKAQSLMRDELLVMMPGDDRLIHDLSMYKKTRKYIRLNSSMMQRESVIRILNAKNDRARRRYDDIKQRVKDLLGRSRLFVGGKSVETSSQNPVDRVKQGFYQLILRTYINLPMLKGNIYYEKDLEKYLQPTMKMEPGETGQAILVEIDNNRNEGRQTMLNLLVDIFQRKPYGWPMWATLCILAKLHAGDKIELQAGDAVLEEIDDIAAALRDTKNHANVLILPQTTYTADQVRNLKRFYENFFHSPPGTADPKKLAKKTAQSLEEEKEKLDRLHTLATQNNYPFAKHLQAPLELLSSQINRSHQSYLTYLSYPNNKALQDLLHHKETILDPIHRFINGPAGELYREVSRFHREQQANYDYIDGGEPGAIARILADPQCYKGNNMQQARKLMVSLKEKITARIQQEVRRAGQAVRDKQQRLEAMEEFTRLAPEEQKQSIQPFKTLVHDLEKQTLVAVIRDKLSHFEEGEYRAILEGLGQAGSGDLYIPIRSIPVTFDGLWLKDSQDVETYIAAFRQALMDGIDKGRRIQL